MGNVAESEPGIGHNHNLNESDRGRLRRAVDQIEGFESQIRDLNAERSGIYKELKQDGFDTKAVRELVRLRKMDPRARENYRETVDAYLAALGMLADTPLGRAALAREGLLQAG